MRISLSALLLVFVSLLAVPAFADESIGRGFVLWSGLAASSCITADCHTVIGRAEYVHIPVAAGDCEACHRATSQPHPGEGSMELVEEEPLLCLQCHNSPADGAAYPHSAVVEGCTSCHSPHQGGLPKFVLQSGGKLCLMCHEDVLAGKYVHGPVKAQNCQMCHGVHGGENEAMLNLPGKENCLACHAGIKQIMDNAVSQHEPVANGVCWDCHTPHSSDYEPFLQAYYPRKLYAAYKDENYSLCFRCHNENAFNYFRTSEATNFRNRDRNLHAFHVNRPSKGRVCKSCHGVHGADQEKLLMSKVQGFGRWAIPIEWANSATGATCYVGCHRPKTYNRESKVKNL